jgi:ABC-type multidrug transport system fused ATPase/permease subunit
VGVQLNDRKPTDSVEYNIAYGCPGASREEVEAAARAAHIYGTFGL